MNLYKQGSVVAAALFYSTAGQAAEAVDGEAGVLTQAVILFIVLMIPVGMFARFLAAKADTEGSKSVRARIFLQVFFTGMGLVFLLCCLFVLAIMLFG